MNCSVDEFCARFQLEANRIVFIVIMLCVWFVYFWLFHVLSIPIHGKTFYTIDVTVERKCKWVISSAYELKMRIRVKLPGENWVYSVVIEIRNA